LKQERENAIIEFQQEICKELKDYIEECIKSFHIKNNQGED